MLRISAQDGDRSALDECNSKMLMRLRPRPRLRLTLTRPRPKLH